MKRKFYDKMLKWRNTDNGSTVLMIAGTRRVGKSYISEEFAKNEYESYIMVDFLFVFTRPQKRFPLPPS